MPTTIYTKHLRTVKKWHESTSHIKHDQMQLEETWWWKPNCGRPTTFKTAPHCYGENVTGISIRLISMYVTENGSRWKYVFCGEHPVR